MPICKLWMVDNFDASLYNVNKKPIWEVPYNMTFGEKLQNLRKQNHLSQEKLAEKLNVSRQAISKWEMGAMPDMDNVIKISNFFDCSLDYLLNNEITEITEENREVKTKQPVLPETGCLLLSLFLLFPITMLGLLSKFVDVGIHRQDAATGNWYTGFAGFVEYYNLQGLIFILALLLVLCLTLRVSIQLFVRKRFQNRRYLFFRTASWGLYMLGIVFWTNSALRPGVFLWNASGYFTAAVFLVLTIGCALAAHHFERG